MPTPAELVVSSRVIVPLVIYLYYVIIEAWCLGYAVNFWSGQENFKLTFPGDFALAARLLATREVTA